MQYTAAFKRRMIARMTGPRAMTATALAQEVGIAQPTLSRWLRDAGTVADMSDSHSRKPSKPRTARDLTVEDRARILAQAVEASPDELGALLRSHGLTSADLDAWKDALGSVGQRLRKPRKSEAEVAKDRQVRDLERELARKEKALAEAAAIIVLQKKVRGIWEDGDDATPPRSER